MPPFQQAAWRVYFYFPVLGVGVPGQAPLSGRARSVVTATATPRPCRIWAPRTPSPARPGKTSGSAGPGRTGEGKGKGRGKGSEREGKGTAVLSARQAGQRCRGQPRARLCHLPAYNTSLEQRVRLLQLCAKKPGGAGVWSRAGAAFLKHLCPSDELVCARPSPLTLSLPFGRSTRAIAMAKGSGTGSARRGCPMVTPTKGSTSTV